MWQIYNRVRLDVYKVMAKQRLTIRRAAVVDSLIHDIQDRNDCILHYFVDTSGATQNSAADIVRALLKQLLIQLQESENQSVTIALSEMKSILRRARGFSSLASLTQLFRRFVENIGQCKCVIDGVDALEEKEVVTFLQFLRDTCGQARTSVQKVRIMIFCRETLGRGIHIEGMAQSATFKIGITHVKRDLHSYVDHQVNAKQEERSITDDTILVEEIKNVLKSNSEKM